MIGIDEVGRGSWAGPLLVCAVRLKGNIDGLKDSKVLSLKKRVEFNNQIIVNADIGYGWVDAQIIDDIGLAKALYLAVSLAIDSVSPKPQEEIIIDGNINYLPYLNSQAIIKADNTIPAVSAASIVAKVARDEYMRELHKKYPKYCYKSNVGYGTKEHKLAIAKYGLTNQHRKSFKISV